MRGRLHVSAQKEIGQYEFPRAQHRGTPCGKTLDPFAEVVEHRFVVNHQPAEILKCGIGSEEQAPLVLITVPERMIVFSHHQRTVGEAHDRDVAPIGCAAFDRAFLPAA
ncbi:hypothetical protein SDC9_207108 [bioreactor metagenome]|uniref:Uncharacterized protein n=1 Tax=bioreactor metagenome TaxID=1076179 RepID=A0A645J7L6_9ZZZZ